MKRSMIIIVSCFLIAGSLHSEEPFGNLPVCFIENRGQLDREVYFHVQASDKTLYFTDRGVTFSLHGGHERYCLMLDFLDKDASAVPEGRDLQQTRFGFYQGPQEEWISDVPAFSTVAYPEIWPGIDLVFRGSGNRLKYEFVVKPGADPGRIGLAYRGATRMAIEDTGALTVSTPSGELEDGAPIAFQNAGNEEVPVRYVMKENQDTVFFDVGTYDRTRTLVIDPAIIVYCGYIGKGLTDESSAIAVDSEGCAYLTGWTLFFKEGYSGSPGLDETDNTLFDVFVAKVTADGTALQYCVYFGGAHSDMGKSIAVDGDGCAYVLGWTGSDEQSFPVAMGPDLTHNGHYDAFVAKVSADGSTMDYCGYLGGAGYDHGHGIAVDADGCAYVTGETMSDEESFPVFMGPDLNFNQGSDAFVAKVNPDGSGLDYCGYLGGSNYDLGYGISVDDQGRACISGETLSQESSFPVVTGPDLTHNGGYDAFVAKVKSDGTALVYCGFIGGKDDDLGRGIASDSSGNAYVTGYTSSDETSFPVLSGPDMTHNGWTDAFVARVNADGSGLDYCGYLGGSQDDLGLGIAADHLGRAHVTGHTLSDETSFPVTVGPDLTHNGTHDVFAACLEADGMNLRYCGFIGGPDVDVGRSIAVDTMGNAYLTGITTNLETAFPVTVGPDLTYNGEVDGFVAKIAMSLAMDAATLPETGGTIGFLLSAGEPRANRNYLLLGGVSGTAPGHPLPGGMATLPLNLDGFTYQVVLPLLNSSLFSNFLGTLDSFGCGTALMTTPALPPGYVGLKIHFAYCLNNPFDFASNPVELEIVF